MIEITLAMLKTGDLNPHMFGYPSIIFYLNAIAHLVYFLIGRSLGTDRAGNIRNSKWRQRAKVVWDWYSPQYWRHHTEGEVGEWFTANGFEKPEFLPVPVGAITRKSISP